MQLSTSISSSSDGVNPLQSHVASYILNIAPQIVLPSLYSTDSAYFQHIHEQDVQTIIDIQRTFGGYHLIGNHLQEIIHIDRLSSEKEQIFRYYYPTYCYWADIITDWRLLVFTGALVLWNTCVFIGIFAECNEYFSANQGLFFLDLVIPLVFFIFQLKYVLLWKGKIGSLFYTNPSIEKLLNQILVYLKSNDYQAISATVESKRTIYILLIFIPIILIMINVNNLVHRMLEINNEHTHCQVMYLQLTGGLTSIFLCCIVSFIALSFLLFTMYLISKLCNQLVNSWISRYSTIKNIRDITLLHDILSFKDPSLPCIVDIESSSCGFHRNINKSTLRRDSYERYLLIYHYMKAISQVASSSVGDLLFLPFLLFIWFFYLSFFSSGSYLALCVCWQIFPACIFLLTVSFLTTCNSSWSETHEKMKYSVPVNESDETAEISSIENEKTLMGICKRMNCGEGDFLLIGGREQWLDYIAANPCYWRVYGFALTPGWLQSLIAGAVTTLLISLIPFLQGFF